MRQVNTHRTWIFMSVVGVLISSGQQQSVSRSDEEHSESVLVEGQYDNANYSYSITIPAGLKAYRAKASVPQHGIMLDISGDKIWVNADYDATFARSADSFANLTARHWFASDRLRIVRNSRTTLAGLPARDLVMEGGRSGGTNKYVHMVLAFRVVPNAVGLIYTIGIQARAKSKQTEKVLSDLVSSFRLVSLPN